MSIIKVNTLAEYEAIKDTLSADSIIYVKQGNKVIFGSSSAGGGGGTGSGRTIEVKVTSDHKLYVRHSELADNEELVILYRARRKKHIKNTGISFVKKKWWWYKHLIFKKGVAGVWYIPEIERYYNQMTNAIENVEGSEDFDGLKGKKMIAPGLVAIDTITHTAPDTSDLQSILNYRIEIDNEDNSYKGWHIFGKNIKNDHAFLAIGIVKPGGNGPNDRNIVVAKAEFLVNVTTDRDKTKVYVNMSTK